MQLTPYNLLGFFTLLLCQAWVSIDLAGQSAPNIFGQENIASCDYYILPDIDGSGLDGTQAYFLSSGGNGQQYSPSDTIFESRLIYAYVDVEDQVDEECFYVHIYHDIELGEDTTVIACDLHLLPPLLSNADIRSGYYTMPGGRGKFYSPGSLIRENISLYAFIETDDCTDQRLYDVVIGQSSDVELRLQHFCPFMVLQQDLLVHITGEADPDSVWLIDPGGNVYSLNDTLYSSEEYMVSIDVGGCIHQESIYIDIVGGIPPEPVDDFVVCGDTIQLPDSEIPNVGRGYYLNELSGFAVNNPYHHRSFPRFGEIQFYSVNALDRCREVNDFTITFLKTSESTDTLFQQICSGQIYPLTFMPTHDSIDFAIDEIVPAVSNPYVVDGQFDTRSIPAGNYGFFLISYSDPVCTQAADTTVMQLEVVDDCALPDTSLIRCSNYVVAQFYPGILGGRIYNDNFELTSDNCCFFEYIHEEDLEVNGSNRVYYIVENQFGVSDTAEITIELVESDFDIGISGTSICYDECIEITAPIDRSTASALIVRGITQSPFLRLISLDESPNHHYLSICFDPLKASEQQSDQLNRDTIFLSTSDTLYTISTQIFADPCLHSTKEFSFNTKSYPVQDISPLICPGKSYSIAGEIFDLHRPSGRFVLAGMAADGCDSIVNVNLQFDSGSELYLNQVYQLQDTIYVNCEPYYYGKETDTIYIDKGPAFCDSIIYIDFTFESLELEVEIALDQLSCTDGILLSALPATAGEYHWFRDSSRVKGAVGPTLFIDPGSGLTDGSFYVFAVTDSSAGFSNSLEIFLPVITHFDTLQLCNREEFIFGDSLIRTSGNYEHIFDLNGCDSIVHLHVEIADEITTMLTESICPDESYDWNGSSLTIAGMYADTLASHSGCDSILQLTLSIEDNPTDELFDSICEGEPYYLSNDTIYEAGVYEEVVLSQSTGCDTIRTVYLYIEETPTGDTLYIQLNEGEIFNYLGQQFFQSGIYSYTLEASSSFCDTLYFLNIQFLEIPDSIGFYLPNIFSPNGDNINDLCELILTNPGQVSVEEFAIYNRWGSLIWSYNPGRPLFWDGRFHNEEALPGVYVVKIRLVSARGEKEVHFRDVTLVR